jgi:ubiquitin-protein ligase
MARHWICPPFSPPKHLAIYLVTQLAAQKDHNTITCLIILDIELQPILSPISICIHLYSFISKDNED